MTGNCEKLRIGKAAGFGLVAGGGKLVDQRPKLGVAELEKAGGIAQSPL